MSDEPKRQRIQERPIDRTKPHYEYCHGSGSDDPQTWIVVARFFAESDWVLAFELADGTSNLLRNQAIRGLKRLFSINENGGAVIQLLSDFEHIVALDPTMDKICNSFANWYGDWHYRRGHQERGQ